ncbi:MAG: S8/S53 family peptidase, partial [Mycobacteriaceae bacterium]|nr:S8/S53 family peptidase [Mycobacteriaceae bacterium]
PAQYTAAFNPTGAQVSAVGAYLQKQGFTNVVASHNNLLVTGSAPASTVAHAFNTSIHNFRMADGSVRYMNVAPATVPATLGASVMSVIGLHDVPQHRFIKNVHPLHIHAPTVAANRAATGKSFNCADNNGTALPNGVCAQDYLWAGELRQAYDDNGAPTAANTSIAIFTNGDAQTVVHDLRQYEYINGERQVPAIIVPVDLQTNDQSGFVEYQMDTQTSTGIAGDVKALYLYNPGGFTDQDSILAYERFDSDDLAQAASGSYGECEYDALLDGTLGPADTLFLQGVAQGQSFFFSSGDNGTSCGLSAATNGVPAVVPPAVNYPASSPSAIGVGGTSLLVNDGTGTYNNETGWNGSGGGISVLEYPAWWAQSMMSTTTAGANAGFFAGRSVPDVAMDADCIGLGDGAAIINQGQQTGNCGTSLASPLALGVFARLQSTFNNQLGNAGPALYGAYTNWGGYNILNGNAPAAPSGLDPLIGGFKDIQVGPNGIYQTTPGFDLVTGMGSFDINRMMVAFGKC